MLSRLVIRFGSTTRWRESKTHNLFRQYRGWKKLCEEKKRSLCPEVQRPRGKKINNVLFSNFRIRIGFDWSYHKQHVQVEIQDVTEWPHNGIITYRTILYVNQRAWTQKRGIWTFVSCTQSMYATTCTIFCYIWTRGRKILNARS